MSSRVNENAQAGLLAWFNVPILTAVVLYGVCTVMWIGALRALPLKVAYPVAALSYVIVPLLGHLFLRENADPALDGRRGDHHPRRGHRLVH